MLVAGVVTDGLDEANIERGHGPAPVVAVFSHQMERAALTRIN